jgi:hypothetical protein
MAKDPMKKTDMEIAHNAANAMSGYSGPSTAKQHSEMTAKYGTAPEGKELYTITNGKAVYKTKEEIADLTKNFPDYSNPNDRAEINYQLREATRQEITPQQQTQADAAFLQKLKGLNERPDIQSATTQPTASNTPITAQTTNPMVGILNPAGDVSDGEMTETPPSFYENFDYLKKLRNKQIKGVENPFDSAGQQAMV